MKNSNRFMLLAGVVGLLLTSVPPVLADNGRGQMWQKADANQDGAIDRAEFDAMRGAHFVKFDGDGNGVVTGAEIEAFVAKRQAEKAATEDKSKTHGERMLQRLDTDSDGTITLAEWQESAEKRFARLDANSDGKIEQAEFSQHRKKKSEAPDAAPAQP